MMYAVNPTIFRAYDIRGVVDVDLSEDVYRTLGHAAGIYFRRRNTAAGARRIVVARDARLTSPAYAAALIAGLRGAGCDVTDIGMAPTPLMYFALAYLKADGGAVVSASHNPPEFNGLKLRQSDPWYGGEPLSSEQLQEVQRIANGDEPGLSEDAGFATGAYEQLDVADAYVQDVARHFKLERPVKIVLDGGNGSGGPLGLRTFQAIGCEVVPLYIEPDGTFPNHHPDPTVPENLRDLQAAVAREVPELGIAFDGDGNRIGAVDEGGRVVVGDQLLVLLVRDLARRLGPGHAVIFDVKCSEVLPQELARVGLTPTMWKTGHSLIKQKMKEVGAPLAGEMSGHMFFGGDWYGFDDALFAAARLLRYVAEQGGPLSRLLADLPATVSTPELRVDCPDELKFAIAARAAAHFAAKYPVSTLDGVRISFGDGWGLLRASNTQPVLVLRFEASTPAALAAHRAEVEGWLATQGIGT